MFKIERQLQKLSEGSVRIHLLDYNRDNAVRHVTWAIDYWLKKREPIPTENPSRCKTCPYLENCQASPAQTQGTHWREKLTETFRR